MIVKIEDAAACFFVQKIVIIVVGPNQKLGEASARTQPHPSVRKICLFVRTSALRHQIIFVSITYFVLNSEFDSCILTTVFIYVLLGAFTLRAFLH